MEPKYIGFLASAGGGSNFPRQGTSRASVINKVGESHPMPSNVRASTMRISQVANRILAPRA